MPGMAKASDAAKGVCGGGGTEAAAVAAAESAVVSAASAVGPAGSAVAAQVWPFMLAFWAEALVVFAECRA